MAGPARHAAPPPLRVLTYNILLGGRYREQHVAAVVARADADVVLLQEVVDLALPRRIARQHGMRMLSGRASDPDSPLYNAILTRLPVQRWRNHRHPGEMLRGHLEAELQTGSAALPVVRVHCVHLSARFGERANGEVRRMRELAAVLRDVDRLPPLPHLIAGDFNAIAPGDVVRGTRFFERIGSLRRAGLLARGDDGMWGAPPRLHELGEHDAEWVAQGVHPHLDVSMPRLPGVVFPLVRRLPRTLGMDRLLNRLIERSSVEHLLQRGYTDCFRRLHPRSPGYTCATWMPAARIDYMFATSGLAERLRDIDVLGSRAAPEPLTASASDHFPLLAEFRL